MDKIKLPSVAGKFYTDDKEDLIQEINNFIKNTSKKSGYESRAVIVPHAGYFYSGQLACECISNLKKCKNIFIIAPSHYMAFEGTALSSYDKWRTPLGDITLNQEICKEINEKFGGSFINEAFTDEHAAEIQVPFIQTFLPDSKIVPILVGKADLEEITEILHYYYQNKDNAFVISSDLSHFYNSQEARKIDGITADMIETNNFSEFSHVQACGHNGVCALLNFCQKNNYSLIRIGLKNSGDITGETTRVVGYGSWMLYEGNATRFIKKYFSERVVEICRESIMSGFNNEKAPEFDNLPSVFSQKGACFVTLEKNGELRGCIGSILAHQSWLEDLVKNSRNSAFFDPRFNPVTADEYEELSIAVSLLSAPVQMAFSDEADLLNQLEPFVDGLIIKDGSRQAVYLPSVWEQLPEKNLFIQSLKIKAGMTPNHFSNTFEAYRFQAEYIKSDGEED